MKPVAARAVLVAAIAALAGAPSALARDYAGFARNIIPSGQYGDVPPPPKADDQALLYDGLTPLRGSVANGDLIKYFKPETFGTRGQGPTRVEKVPRKGVRIVRDRWNVPHITGKTRADVAWGAGWVTIEDRYLLIGLARNATALAALDVPGLDPFGVALSGQRFEPSRQTERFLARQTGVLRRQGPKGRQLLRDIDSYIAGGNAYYRATNRPDKPLTRNDVYAVNAFAGRLFGRGGGDEAARSMFLDGLRDRLGRPARTERLERHARAARPRGADDDRQALPVPERVAAAADRQPRARRRQPRAMGVRARRQRDRAGRGDAEPAAHEQLPDGRPAALRDRPPAVRGRPADRLLLPRADARDGPPRRRHRHARRERARVPRLHADRPRPGLRLEPHLGGQRHDRRVRRDALRKRHALPLQGTLPAMGTFDAGTLAGRKVRFRTTVHGPVTGYGTVGGKRVAIAEKRASRGRDVLWQLLFQDLSMNRPRNARQFLRMAASSPFTFNVAYADDRDIAMFSAGRLPLRAPGVDPGLPTDGRGGFEWRGFLPARRHPQVINPKSGELVNWNNKPARGFPAADDQWGYGSIYRSDMLEAGLRKRRKHTLASVVSAMNAAATTDFRAAHVWPVVAQVLRKGGLRPPSDRARRMYQLLNAWAARGASRLDRALDGKIDDPGAAIIDSAWPRIADAVLSPLLGPLVNSASGLGSSAGSPITQFIGGRTWYVHKDLRTLLGRKVRGRYANRYCGRGRLAPCQASLWGAIEDAGAELAAAQGADPGAWRADANAERIHFDPGVLGTTMRFTNRPSGIQQVLWFKGHRRR